MSKLTVRVVAARNLLAMDKGGASDPFVTVAVDGVTRKTPVKKKTLAPRWEASSATFTYHPKGSNDFIGKLAIEALPDKNTQWYKLSTNDGIEDDKLGEIQIETNWEVDENEVQAQHGIRTPPLHVRVQAVQARNLIAADRDGMSDPFVIFKLDRKTKKTSAVKKSLNPQWDERSSIFRFDTEGGNAPVLNVTVMDHDLIGSNDFMGMVDIPVEVRDEPVKRWYKLLSNKGTDEKDFGEIELFLQIIEIGNHLDSAITAADVENEADVHSHHKTKVLAQFEVSVYEDPTNHLPDEEEMHMKLDAKGIELEDQDEKVWEIIPWKKVMNYEGEAADDSEELDNLSIFVEDKGEFIFEVEDWKAAVKAIARVAPERPETITIAVIQGRNLKAMDKGGSSDPYVVVKCGDKTEKTKTVKRSLNPEFDSDTSKFTFNTASGKDATILLNVMDYDLLGKDDFMGKLELDVVHGQQIKWFPLTNKDSSADTSLGELELEIERSTRKTDNVVVEEYPGLHVRVHVISGRNLKAMDDDGKADPFVKVKIEDAIDLFKHSTRVCRGNLNPKWDKHNVFNLESDAGKPTVVLAEIFDADAFTKNDFMGLTRITVDAGVPMNDWYPLCDKKGKTNRKLGELHLAIESLPRTKATLTCTIQVVQGRWLAAKDKNGTASPYCIVKLTTDAILYHKTEVRQHTLNPRFSEDTSTFRYEEIERRIDPPKFHITVMDSDSFGKDDLIGEVFAEAEVGKTIRQWYTLENEHGSTQHGLGDVMLEIECDLDTLQDTTQTAKREAETEAFELETSFRETEDGQIVGVYTYEDPSGELPEEVNIKLGPQRLEIADINEKLLKSVPWSQVSSYRGEDGDEAAEEMDNLYLNIKGMGVFSFECEDWKAVVGGIDKMLMNIKDEKQNLEGGAEDDVAEGGEDEEKEVVEKPKVYNADGALQVTCEDCGDKYFSGSGRSRFCVVCRKKPVHADKDLYHEIVIGSTHAKELHVRSDVTAVEKFRAPPGTVALKCNDCDTLFFSLTGTSLFCVDCRETPRNQFEIVRYHRRQKAAAVRKAEMSAMAAMGLLDVNIAEVNDDGVNEQDETELVEKKCTKCGQYFWSRADGKKKHCMECREAPPGMITVICLDCDYHFYSTTGKNPFCLECRADKAQHEIAEAQVEKEEREEQKRLEEEEKKQLAEEEAARLESPEAKAARLEKQQQEEEEKSKVKAKKEKKEAKRLMKEEGEFKKDLKSRYAMIDPDDPGLGIGAYSKSKVANRAGIATMKRLTIRSTFEQEYGDILPKQVKIEAPTEKLKKSGTFYSMVLRMPESCHYSSKTRTISFADLQEFKGRLPEEDIGDTMLLFPTWMVREKAKRMWMLSRFLTGLIDCCNSEDEPIEEGVAWLILGFLHGKHYYVKGFPSKYENALEQHELVTKDQFALHQCIVDSMTQAYTTTKNAKAHQIQADLLQIGRETYQNKEPTRRLKKYRNQLRRMIKETAKVNAKALRYRFTAEVRQQWEHPKAALYGLDEPHHENIDCMICQFEFNQDEFVRTLPCGHMFHALTCIEPWMELKMNYCPVCYQKIAKKV